MSSIQTGVSQLEHMGRHNHDHGHGHGHDHHHHDHDHEHGLECCAHHELELERWILAYCVGGLLVFVSTLARWLHLAPDEIAAIPAAIGAVVLGAGLFYSAWIEIKRGNPSSSTLAAIAILAAIATGKYEAAGYLAFILLVADQALRRTAWGARRAIEDLVHLTPETARVIENNAEKSVGLGEVRVGMTVRVRPGENLPVDGVVVSGRSSVNQASLTGEAMPVEVEPGGSVYAGTTNLTGVIDLRVTSVGEDTTIGKVAALIREAESARTPRQLLIEQVARYFVPVALVTAGLVWYLTQNIDTAITVLVVVCPSALLIASPTAMMASFAAAARLGILIKQTSYLESASTIDTVVLDKTGTLTTGKFAVSRLAPATGVEGAELLQAAADAEQGSNHPLARSIVTTASQARVEAGAGWGYEEVHGRGVRAKQGGSEIVAGRPSWIVELNAGAKDEVSRVEARIEGMTGVHVMKDGRYLGAVGLEDKLRFNAKSVVERLRELGIRSVSLFTGDRFAVAKRVGVTVGVDQIEAECLPEEKHDLIRRLVARGARVMMVGDGINDGPSLAAADVGVAMGLSGSDIATNSAGVALMTDDLSRIPFLIQLARRTRAIIAQNIAASIVIAIIGLTIAATGHIAISLAAFYHFVGDLFVIGNSFRLIRFGEEFSSAEQQATVQAATRQAAEGPARRASASMRPAPAGA
ncbi:MAG TPA: cation-translocating P-type ATPase [Phycisphaerales bacterium]|nr:cation-translocating P-type ATPase [Phycisphaerales bacterium]